MLKDGKNNMHIRVFFGQGGGGIRDWAVAVVQKLDRPVLIQQKMGEEKGGDSIETKAG